MKNFLKITESNFFLPVNALRHPPVDADDAEAARRSSSWERARSRRQQAALQDGHQPQVGHSAHQAQVAQVAQPAHQAHQVLPVSQ